MTRVVFWKNGQQDGCSFYRCDEPARALNELTGQRLDERGRSTIRNVFDCLSTMVMPDSVYMDADVIVGQRIAEDGPTELWRRLSTGELGVRPKLVYELDDDLLNVPESFGPVHTTYADPRRRSNILVNLARADIVTTTNAHLAERINDIMPDKGNIRVIPNYVPARFVLPAVPERTGPLVIGWAGSGSHREDFEQVIEPLRTMLREHEARVYTMGLDYFERLSPVREWRRGTAYSYIPWVDGVPAYYEMLNGFDVGIAPLVDNTFNRSKSDVKLKEYAARGICAVASDVGPYRHRVRGGSDVPHFNVTGLQGSEWIDWFEVLAEDPELVQFERDDALKWAQENTLEKHIGLWEEAVSL